MFKPRFTRVYYEKEALESDIGRHIAGRLSNAQFIEVRHYKNVFCGHDQNFLLQKESPGIILAVKKSGFLYEGSGYCHAHPGYRSFYTAPVVNCIYDCEYCYLQGTYPSANILVFTNFGDFIKSLKDELENGPVYLPVSFDSDMLALENMLGYCRLWIESAREMQNLLIELRTKSANYKSISDIAPPENVLLSWTLSPADIIENYERKTPGLDARLESVNKAISDGWKVRLCIDPVILFDNWNTAYPGFISYIFNRIPPDKLYDINTGPFRMPAACLDRIRKMRPQSLVAHFPYHCENGTCRYPGRVEEKLMKLISSEISKHVEPGRIHVFDRFVNSNDLTTDAY